MAESKVKKHEKEIEEKISMAATNKNTYRNLINEVLNYTNQYRQEKGLKALKLNEKFTQAACARAIELTESFSHTRPDGRSFDSIMVDMKYNVFVFGENIAYGSKYSTAKAVSEGWKNSPGHYANMINSNFGSIGIGIYKVNGIYYWVQLFGG